jgi:hypothetical protein
VTIRHPPRSRGLLGCLGGADCTDSNDVTLCLEGLVAFAASEGRLERAVGAAGAILESIEHQRTKSVAA